MLRREMESDNFTPTVVHMGLRPHHNHTDFTQKDAVQTATLVIGQHKLPLTNGGHRLNALGQIRTKAEAAVSTAKTDKEKQEAQKFLALVDLQPITAMILLNGDPQDDFINPQKGKKVDSAHLFSMKVQWLKAGDKNAVALKMAVDVARLLHNSKQSPLHNMIRFDTKGLAPLPISSLCSKESSDLGTSLLGLARVGLEAGKPKSAEWLANCVLTVLKVLKEKAPTLLEEGRMLTPPPDGSKGSAGLLIGVSLALAYRLIVLGQEVASTRDHAILADAAKETLDETVNGNFSGPDKRSLLGRFVEELFQEMTTIDKHAGIPLGLF